VVSALRLRLELPAPQARTDSNDIAKHTGEMGLVAHAAAEGDLRKRLASVQHEDLGVAYPPHSNRDTRRGSYQPRPGRRVVTSWTSHALPSGSPKAKNDP